MNKINLLLTTANDNLSDSKETIKKAVKIAEEYTFPKLNINWDIDVLVTNRLNRIIIPEDGVGGRTQTSDFIELAINEKKATGSLIAEMLVHELCHAARWGKNDEWTQSLFDELINEGIATVFEAQFAESQKEKQFFITTILNRSDKENETILEKLQNQLDSNNYDYNVIFFNGNNDLPRWSGYSLGYYLIKKYLAETNKTIEQAFTDKYAEYKNILLNNS